MNDFLFQKGYYSFAAILLGSLFIARVLLFVLQKYVSRFTKKTKTDLDDMILKIIEIPIYVLFIVFGSYFALFRLNEIQPYISLINKAFFVILTLIVSITISKIADLLIGRWFKVKRGREKAPQLINKLAAIAIYLIALLMILGYLEVEITPLVATLGLGGLAIGLALQNTLLNFFSGLHIISDKPVNVGDFVELEGGISGYVEDIGWRSTRVKTIANNIVIIPNSKLAESTIVNDSLPEKDTGVLVQCGVSYESDLDKVESVTINIAKKIQKTIPGAMKDYEPFMRYHSFGDSNINFSIILRVEKFVDKYLVIHEFIKALKKGYDKENIEISWPVRKVYREK